MYSSKHSVDIVQKGTRFECNKKLRSVRVGPRIRHADNASTHVLEVAGDFVLELVTVDRCSTPSCSRRIASLDHEITHHTVKNRAIVVARVCQSRHVVAGPGCVLVIKLNDKGALFVEERLQL